MTKGIEALRDTRIRFVEICRLNGFEAGIKKLLTELYPDNAHFIYELLQNAEDTGARTVRFILSEESLDFEHDGDRLFDLKDVEAITNIGDSTKKDDPTKVGKFGVGFKAVFAYTSTPEIHSGEFSFQIRDLVVPEICSRKESIGGRKTLFIFPFNHPTKKPLEAVAEIERGLRDLGHNTLLFLESIRSIEFLLPDGSFGSLERVDHDDGRIEIKSRRSGGGDNFSNWLRFQSDVTIDEDDGKRKGHRVAIAYALVKGDAKKGEGTDWRIVSAERGQVSIYFPAEKETSNLRFHIHAPFASTVARDSIRDCTENRVLRDRIAQLVAESISEICKKQMLTMGFLGVLPNEQDGLSEFYEPIRCDVVKAFIEQPLMLTREGSYAPAKDLLRGPARIAELISDDDLQFLVGEDSVQWAANPPQQNQREDRFIDSLGMEDWGWSQLCESCSDIDEPERTDFENWIAAKDDAWLMRLYSLFGEAWQVHHQYLNVDGVKIIRAMDESGIIHVLSQQAYFPSDQESVTPSRINFVKEAVYRGGSSEYRKKYATLFLEYSGVRKFEIAVIIEMRLAHYKEPLAEVTDSHLDDLKIFVEYWKQNPTSVRLFSRHSFLVGQNGSIDPSWCLPGDLCIDLPFCETGLAKLSGIHQKSLLWEGYRERLPANLQEDFLDFVRAVGVISELKVTSASTAINPNWMELRRDYHHSRVRWTNTGINEDYTIYNLDKYIEAQSIESSRLIWSTLIKAGSKCAKARFRPNQNFTLREGRSQLVLMLQEKEWIPDATGQFRRASDMSPDQLRRDFPFDDRNGLLTAIGFGENARQSSEAYKKKSELAKEMGFPSLDKLQKMAKYVELVEADGGSIDEMISAMSRRSVVAQPEEAVPNPERRRKGMLERAASAPSKESVKRERSIFVNVPAETVEAQAYLRVKYKNADGQMICQCCQKEMPFKVNGEYYFEAVQCLRQMSEHHFVNRLALCPTCAAMYRHARETDDREIRRQILEAETDETASSEEIVVMLAGQELGLRFVGTHWFDLKTVIEAMSVELH